jgi:putative membrane protein insertion efficiency factor
MIAHLVLFLIRIYQRTLSPLLGPICRFTPSCSRYMATCVERYGAARGVWLGLRRLSHCHPFHPGGVDLPPECESAGQAGQRHALSRPSAAESGEARTLEQRP